MRLAYSSPLLFAGLLSAQFVSPSHYANAEGTGNNVFPFGNTTVPFRFEQVHDNVPAMTISGLAFRHNAATTVYPAHAVTIDAWISTAAFTSATATADFDTNHGTDKVQVATGVAYNHPASDPRCVPGDFILRYPFSSAMFAFAGSPASVCWEVHVTAKTQTTSIVHDAISGTAVANPALAVGRGGLGCIATGRTTQMLATGTSTMNWAGATGTLTVNTSNGPANAPVFHFIGVEKVACSGLPLPIELPGTSGGASGPCYLHTCYLGGPVNSGRATATGTWSSAFPVPANPWNHGFTLLSQIVALDTPANNWGLVTSPLVAHNWVAPCPASDVARIYLSGALGNPGTLSLSASLVTRFF
jgi:hypothetical protein